MDFSTDQQARLQRQERLLNVFRELTSIVSLGRLLHRIVEAAAEVTDTESAAILLHDGVSGQLRFIAASRYADELLNIPVPIEGSIAGAAFASGQPVLVDNVSADPRHYRTVGEEIGFKAQSLLAVPLQYLLRRVGVLEAENKRNGAPFNDDDISILTMLATQATVAIENARLFETLEQHRTQLEGLVDERVAEIKHINTQLQAEVQERRRAEDELRKLARAVEHSASTVVITDTAPRIEYVNPAFTRITGYTLDEVRGKNPRFLKSGRHPREFYHNLWETLLRGEVWRGEFINRRKTGELYYEASRIAPVLDAAGNTTHFIAVKDDVTDQKKAQEALYYLNERLKILREIDQAILGAQSPSAIARAGLSRLAQLVPAKRMAVVEFDTDGGSEVLAIEAARGFSLDINVWLKQLHTLTGQRSFVQGVADIRQVAHRTALHDQLLAEGLHAYTIVPLLDEERVIGALILETDQPHAFIEDHVNIAAEIAGMLAVALRQAQLRASLAIRTTELEAQNAELDAFAHTVAHDLKNPLGVVSGYTEFLAMYLDQLDPSELKEAANLAAHSAWKAVDIVNNLLLLASTNKEAVESRPLDMAKIVQETQHRLRNMIKEYQPDISLPLAWPTALGHGPWVEEVWVNYISNALKYGGRPPHLELGAELLPIVSDSSVITSRPACFWVKDNGPGLTPEEQARLFTPFERLSQIKVSGYGLGLSIVKRIVEKLGGTVGVESAIGQGSTFYFTLPAIVNE
jgi:PAS domain S-box-containing protein